MKINNEVAEKVVFQTPKKPLIRYLTLKLYFKDKNSPFPPEYSLNFSKSPQRVIYFNEKNSIIKKVLHIGGKIMHHFKALKTRTWLVISLILGFAMVAFGCDTGKLFSGELFKSKSKQVSAFSDFEISAKAVPEGILVTFYNIPPEIEQLTVSFADWGDSKDAELKIWDDGEPLAVMNSISRIHMHQTCKNVIEQVRQTGTITFPFVQPGRKYEITAYFYDDVQQGWTELTARAECVADGGIYLDRDITININDAHTRVALSGKPALTSDVQLKEMFYYISIHKGDNIETISSDKTNDLFWDFEPNFSEHLKEAGVANGDYPANVGVQFIIIHDNISWLLESVKTPVFIYFL